MGIEFGIVGLPNVGKSTLFKALTRARIAAENCPFCTIDPNVGVVPVPDPRLQQLAAIAKPEKILFTAGPKEVRAWTVRSGAAAPQAAGVIQTDFERGFIRSEVVGFADYLAARARRVLATPASCAWKERSTFSRKGTSCTFDSMSERW